jgi:hypothetical protein
VYKAAPEIAKDAGRSASAAHEWTRFDEESATGVNLQIIDRYLARTYHAKRSAGRAPNMCHSAEFDAQVEQYAVRPPATYANDEQVE